MRRSRVMLLAVFWAAAFAFGASGQVTNLPPTRLEALETRTNTVIVRGYSVMGSVTTGTETVSIGYRESTDAVAGDKEHGLFVKISAGENHWDAVLVDYDELLSLIPAINYVSKVDYSVTPLTGFDAYYTTKAGLRISAHTSRRSEAIQVTLQIGQPASVRMVLSRDQLAQFHQLIQQSKTRLDELRARK